MRTRIAGFNLIESMIALAILASLMLTIIAFNKNNQAKKESKLLALQTEAFANAFAKYMNDNFVELENKTSSASLTLSPQSVIKEWPLDLAQQNFLKQTPCVTIIKNSNTNDLEAIMYYVGGKNMITAPDYIRNASLLLGSKGGIYSDGHILGNSGWVVKTGSPFLTSTQECGGVIPNNSLAINIDLLPNWNQNLQPVYSLLRGTDTESDLLSLPGHIKNANTLKSNLYFSPGNGVILDNTNPNNPTKLSVQYNGQGTGAATLGFGNATTRLIADTFQPNLSFSAGQVCNLQEVGKVVADQGVNDSTNSVLSRSTLVCTQNDMLCGAGNACYLPTLPNQITFQNLNRGIQDVNGQFLCPKSVPFGLNVKTAIANNAKIYVVLNYNGKISPSSVLATLYKPGWSSPSAEIIYCPTGLCNYGFRTDYKSGIIDGKGEIIQVDLASVSGSSVGMYGAGATPITDSVQGVMGNYTTTLGYRVALQNQSCSEICGNLGNQLGYSWQMLGTRRLQNSGLNLTIANSGLGCACERTDFGGWKLDNYYGIAFVLGSLTPIITSATCSNLPLFVSH